ncbi:MAG TPA: hypothetical protein VGL23_04385 [Chloroflexota bacterium]
MRRDVEERLDRVLREALVVEPPPELQARLMALVQSAPLARPATPQRRWLLWLDPNVWLGLVAIAVLGWSAWSTLAWLAGFTFVLGDVPAALIVLASSPAVGLLPRLGLDLTSLALWCAVGAVVWLLNASGALETALPDTRA